MNASTYLATLDAKIRALQGIIMGWSIQREMDANLGIGFTEGHIAFTDGSRLEFDEQAAGRVPYRLLEPVAEHSAGDPAAERT